MIENQITGEWERKTLEKLLFETLREQKRSRRWRIFFRVIYLTLFIIAIMLIFSDHSTDYYNRTKDHTAIIDIKGTISDSNTANAKDINKNLDSAFSDPKTKAVMLKINSPGGSPVQAFEVYEHLHFLENKYPATKVYAVCTDSCASGAYYIAAGANYIYADKASLVGSIGVLMNGFGFVDTLKKVGMERRLLTSGAEKGFLDPFSPVKPEDEQYMKNMLDIIHAQFIQVVKDSRGKHLKNDPLLFSGMVWTGEQAKGLGLIDGIATPDYVARNIIKQPTTADYSSSEKFFQKFASNIGSSAGSSAANHLGLITSLLH